MDTTTRLRSHFGSLLHSAVPWRVALPTTLLLAALAFAGNSLTISLFINARLLFGTVFVVLAIGVVGAPWALLVGLANAVAAELFWGYPSLAAVFLFEAVWLALLFQPRENNVVVRMGAYWVAMGAPFALLVSVYAINVDASAAGLFAVTRILNGLLNALIGDFLLRMLPRIPWARRTFGMEEQHALENLLLSAMIGLILVPSLIIVTIGARSMQNSAEQLVRGELQLTASSFAESMTGWLDENYQNLRSLAHVAGVHHQRYGNFAAMAPQIDIIKHADADFLALALFRPDGDAVHIRPDVEPPQEGRNALMNVREAIVGGAEIGLSSSFPMQAVGRRTRAVVLAAPVKGRRGSLVAIAAGILDASSVHSQLESTRGQRDINVAVHDGSGHLFSSSDAAKHKSSDGAAGLAPASPRKSGMVEVQHYGSTLTRVGVALNSMAYAVDLSGGYYQMRMPLEGYPGWEVSVTRYLDDTLAAVVQRNIGALLLTFAVVLVVGLVALFFSRTIVSSISALKVAGAEASHRITGNATVPWPRSHIKEVSSLSENFQVMSKELRESFARLEEARDRAEQASLAKSRFLQNVSHELRTPLNGILGFAQILENDEEFPEEYRDTITGIVESGNDLLLFIKDLLIHAKIDSQHLRLEPKPVTIRETIAHVASTVRPSAEAKRLEFHVEIDESLPAIIRVDEKRLQQILYNLLSNAVAYTEAGTVHLRVFPESYGDSGGHERVVFSVEDTGPGIPEDEIDAIFSPLRQLERHPQSRGGTGLGLSIVKRLVEMMGGRIHVDSTVGTGSTFYVHIPLSRS